MYKQFLELNGILVSANGTYEINGMVFPVDVPLRVAIQASYTPAAPAADAAHYIDTVSVYALALAPVHVLANVPANVPVHVLAHVPAHIVDDAYAPRSPVGPPPPLAPAPAHAPAQVYDLTIEDNIQETSPTGEEPLIIAAWQKGIRSKVRALAAKQANTNFDCPICYESSPYMQSMVTNCDHRYCSKCAATLIRMPQRRLNCPLCRTECCSLTYYKPRKVAVKGK